MSVEALLNLRRRDSALEGAVDWVGWVGVLDEGDAVLRDIFANDCGTQGCARGKCGLGLCWCLWLYGDMLKVRNLLLLGAAAEKAEGPHDDHEDHDWYRGRCDDG